jgi:hypothetical protein
MDGMKTLLCRASALALCLGLASAAEAVVIGFDQDAFGHDIPHLAVIDNEYAAMGVHFGGGFRAARRTYSFPTYTANTSLNHLCTGVGATTPNIRGCAAPPIGTPMEVRFDFDVAFASIEGFTRNDGPFDRDLLRIEAYDIFGALIGAGSDICDNNPPPHRTEGICTASVSAAGIRRLLIHPVDQDVLDTLTYELPEGPPVPEPGTLVLLGTGLVAAGSLRRRRARRG